MRRLLPIMALSAFCLLVSLGPRAVAADPHAKAAAAMAMATVTAPTNGIAVSKAKAAVSVASAKRCECEAGGKCFCVGGCECEPPKTADGTVKDVRVAKNPTVLHNGYWWTWNGYDKWDIGEADKSAVQIDCTSGVCRQTFAPSSGVSYSVQHGCSGGSCGSPSAVYGAYQFRGFQGVSRGGCSGGSCR